MRPTPKIVARTGPPTKPPSIYPTMATGVKKKMEVWSQQLGVMEQEQKQVRRSVISINLLQRASTKKKKQTKKTTINSPTPHRRKKVSTTKRRSFLYINTCLYCFVLYFFHPKYIKHDSDHIASYHIASPHHIIHDT